MSLKGMLCGPTPVALGHLHNQRLAYCFTGLRIQRMPSEIGQEFGNPASYPYMVVCSPSCHDTSTTRAWFEEDDSRRERFCSDVLGINVRTPTLCSLARRSNCIITW
jgi:4-alpha-glucanotransferase